MVKRTIVPASKKISAYTETEINAAVTQHPRAEVRIYCAGLATDTVELRHAAEGDPNKTVRALAAKRLQTLPTPIRV